MSEGPLFREEARVATFHIQGAKVRHCGRTAKEVWLEVVVNNDAAAADHGPITRSFDARK